MALIGSHQSPVPTGDQNSGPPWRWFVFACAFELILGLIALTTGHFTGRSLGITIRWSLSGWLWGVAGAVPLLALLVVLLTARSRWFEEITTFLDKQVRPIFGQWTCLQFGVLSILAGFGEELLFRALIQGELARLAGTVAGLVVASALFGAFHCVTRGYALLAGLIGAYLGLLWIVFDNLLVPMLAHALYDWIALIYFFRIRNPARAVDSGHPGCRHEPTDHGS